MFQEVLNIIFDVIGEGSDDLTVWQTGLRAFLIFLTAILLVKFGEKRFMGKNTAFDMILGIILGFVLSRAVTGNALFFNVIGAGIILVGIHWLFAFVSYYSDWLGSLIKGNPRVLVKDGEIQWTICAKVTSAKKIWRRRSTATAKSPKLARSKLRDLNAVVTSALFRMKGRRRYLL